jgi:hypothetical protein
VLYANPAAGGLFELSGGRLEQSSRSSTRRDRSMRSPRHGTAPSYTEQEPGTRRSGKPRLHLSCTVSVIDIDAALLLEWHIDQQLKIARM